MKIISPEVKQRVKDTTRHLSNPRTILDKYLDAQLSADKEELLKWFKKLEKSMAVEALPFRDGGDRIRSIPDETWQSSKQQILGECDG